MDKLQFLVLIIAKWPPENNPSISYRIVSLCCCNCTGVDYCVLQKTSTFVFSITCQTLTDFINFWYYVLNHEKIWHEHLTDLSISPVRCSHFTLGNPKMSFSTLLFIYFRSFTLPQKKTSSNCCTAALAVYLLMFSASYYLHSPSTASGPRYRRSACIDMDVLRLAAAACCDMGWTSARRGVPCYRPVSKKIH